jgi:hypothetical protein
MFENNEFGAEFLVTGRSGKFAPRVMHVPLGNGYSEREQTYDDLPRDGGFPHE